MHDAEAAREGGDADQEQNPYGLSALRSPAADAGPAREGGEADQEQEQNPYGQRAPRSPAFDAEAAREGGDADRFNTSGTAEPAPFSIEKRKAADEAAMLADLRSELRKLTEDRDNRERELLERLSRFEAGNLAPSAAETGNPNPLQLGSGPDAPSSKEFPKKIPDSTQGPASGGNAVPHPPAGSQASVHQKENENPLAVAFIADEQQPSSPERIDVEDGEEEEGTGDPNANPVEGEDGERSKRSMRKTASPPPSVAVPPVRQVAPPPLPAIPPPAKAKAAGQTKELVQTSKNDRARGGDAFTKKDLPALPPLPSGNVTKTTAKANAGVGAGVCHVHPDTTLRTAAQLQALQRQAAQNSQKPAPPLSHPESSKKKLAELYPKTPATHDGRVIALHNCGWRLCDAVAALEATRDEEGAEDMDAANTYLLEQHA